ncbi:MAG: hypothetical protein U9R19_09050, partial [Bacteroidota bacterium]|nr:hypothetical protein [Bacteroidota bacterium]
QSEIAVEVKNTTNEDYVCSVQFNQSVTPNAGSSPTVFTVTAGNTYDASYDFDEDDVNLRGCKCVWISGGTVGYIAVSSGVTTSVDVSPLITPPSTYHQFYFSNYSAQGSSEHVWFEINP